MPKPSKTWKDVERKVAAVFGAKRNPLSGSNSGGTASDSRHPRLYIETKYRKRHAVMRLFEDTRTKAIHEGKTPIVALKERGQRGFLVVCEIDDIQEIAKEMCDG